jgi:tellurite methyltransferase
LIDPKKSLDPISPLFLKHRREILGAENVLDLASGRGRHALALPTRRGGRLVALDRNRRHLAQLCARVRGAAMPNRVWAVCADLEKGLDPPLRRGVWDVVLVFRYLHRPLCAWIQEALRPGGLLLYETFTEAQQELEGGPSNPAFLLRADELPALFPALGRLSYEEKVDSSRNQALASFAGRRPASS